MIIARCHCAAKVSPVLLCTAGLWISLQAGCNNPNPKESRPAASPTQQMDKAFAEGAGRPATPKTQYAYARILSSQRQDAACDSLLTRLIAENPRFLPPYLLQAEVRMRMRRIDDALLTLTSALRIAPNDDILLNNLGVCYLMKPDCSNAFECFIGAASLKPSNARYRANMALALGLMDRKDEAASLYKLVISVEDADRNVAVLDSARDAYLGISTPPARQTTQSSQPTEGLDSPVKPESNDPNPSPSQ